ncbi:MAG: phosphatase PAP2/dual specificity phosphatase family protein [Casimicrobiaceae bacterium]
MADRSEAPHPWRRALAWLAFLGPFFFATYAFANWTASLHTAVPSIVFDWERHIPFLPWTIVPYWIIDALYGISLFLCASKRELDTHALRLLTAQVVAVACFIAFPHRFTFAHPPADGVFGALFDVLLGFDRPFNQLPSLHIALAVILWTLYARKTRGAPRVVVDVAFVMICASVLTTFQHHFIDIPTGFALGWLCVWLWPDEESLRPLQLWQRTSDPRRWRLAAYYLAGALACTMLAFALRGWTLWLLWPALSLGFVAAFYAGVGANGFQKDRDGKLSLAARWLLAPYLAGAWANSRAWTRTHPQPSHLADGVWIGRTPSARDLASTPNAAIVDLAAELSLPRNARRRIVSANAETGRRETAVAVVPVLDLTLPPRRALDDAAQAIERLRAQGPVLVCCALGYSRSACAAAAWLLATGRAATVDAAFARIQAAREHVVLDAGHAAVLAPLARVATR